MVTVVCWVLFSLGLLGAAMSVWLIHRLMRSARGRQMTREEVGATLFMSLPFALSVVFAGAVFGYLTKGAS